MKILFNLLVFKFIVLASNLGLLFRSNKKKERERIKEHVEVGKRGLRTAVGEAERN